MEKLKSQFCVQTNLKIYKNFVFHSRTVHIDIIKVFIYQLMYKRIA